MIRTEPLSTKGGVRAIKNLGGKVGRIPASILKCWCKVGEKFLITFQEIPNPRQVFSCFFDETWNFRFSNENYRPGFFLCYD